MKNEDHIDGMAQSKERDLMNTEPVNPFVVTFPSVEKAVSALCERVFGAGMEIEPEPVCEPGYRMLEDHETLQEGDEFQDFDGRWMPTERTAGSIVAGLPKHSKVPYRRPLPAPAQEPEPATYRMLDDCETLQEGDEFQNHEGKWKRTGNPGVSVESTLMGPYRRPLPEKPEYALKALAEMAHDRDRWRKEAGRLDAEAESWSCKARTLEADCESWRRKAAESDSECVRLCGLWNASAMEASDAANHLRFARGDLALMTAEKNEWAKMAQDTARERDRWEQVAGEFAEKVARVQGIVEEDEP